MSFFTEWTTKKIMIFVFSGILVIACAFAIIWTATNWKKVTSGTNLYTQSDIKNAYDDGYDTALENKATYETLINSYKDTIVILNGQVTSLTVTNNDRLALIINLQGNIVNLNSTITTLESINNSNETLIGTLLGQVGALQEAVNTLTQTTGEQSGEIATMTSLISTLQAQVMELENTKNLNLQTINSLNTQVATLSNELATLTALSGQGANQIVTLQNKIAELENSITYYQALVETLNPSNMAIATFTVNSVVYDVQTLPKNTTGILVTNPTSTTYVIFNGWTVGGSAVNLATYVLTQSVTFVADVTNRYDVKFMYENNEYANRVITHGESVNNVTNPSNTSYKEFKGWSFDGINIVNVPAFPITMTTTFFAVIEYSYDVSYMMDGNLYSTQIVKGGTNPTLPANPTKQNFDFVGWSLDGVNIVNPTVHTITGNTTFLAMFLAKPVVTFLADGVQHATQIVSRNGYATTPTPNPSKTNHDFKGWSLDGVTVINLATQVITQNTTFHAVFEYRPLVQFLVDGSNIKTERVSKNGTATAPANPSKTNFAFIGWSVDGVNTVNVATYQIALDTNFVAKFDVAISTINVTSFGTGNNNVQALAQDSNNVYMGANFGGKFAIYNKATGDIGNLIDVGFGTSMINAIAVDNNNVYIGGVLGKFAVYNKATGLTGALKTMPSGWGTNAIHTIAVDGNNVYVGGASGKFAIYNISAGTFGNTLSVPHTTYFSGMAQDGNLIYCVGGWGSDSFFVIFNKTTNTFGSLLNKGGIASQTLISVTFDANNVYIGSSTHIGIWSKSSQTMTQVINCGMWGGDFASIVSVGNYVYLAVSSYQAGTLLFGAYNKTTGTFSPLFQDTITASLSMVFDGTHLYIGCYAGKLYKAYPL